MPKKKGKKRNEWQVAFLIKLAWKYNQKWLKKIIIEEMIKLNRKSLGGS